MTLRALARCCSHPPGSGWQSSHCQAGLGVSCAEWHSGTEDIEHKDPLLSYLRASRKILLYIIFWGKSSHKFQGEGLYFDSYFHLSAFTWFRKPIPSCASSLEGCSLTAVWACCLLSWHTLPPAALSREVKYLSIHFPFARDVQPEGWYCHTLISGICLVFIMS